MALPKNYLCLHKSRALTFHLLELVWLTSTVERNSFNKQSLIRSRLSDSFGEVIRWTTGPEKTDMFCEELVGVRDCENSNRIKGCDGTWIHVVDSLAGVGG